MTRRRILLFGVAALLCASALLAIAILLVGRFGDIERNIVATTLLLAGYGVVSLPGVMLLDQARARPLAAVGIALAAAAAALAVVSVWSSGGDALGKSVGTATVFALGAAQTAALEGRRRESDPPVVALLFAVSCVTAVLAAGGAAALIWTAPNGSFYARLLGALVVLDLLLVALQPVLGRALPPPRRPLTG